MKNEAKITYGDNTECSRSYIRHSSRTEATKKKLPNLQACGRGIWKTKLSFMKNKTYLVAHNYTLSSVNHMYASKMVKEMLMNLCYTNFNEKNFLEKITEY